MIEVNEKMVGFDSIRRRNSPPNEDRWLEWKNQHVFLGKSESDNGLITNDKFCMVRSGCLTLSHWHRPLRLRQSKLLEYSALEVDMCGGQDETAVASASNDDAERGWAKTLGSGVPNDPGNQPNAGAESSKAYGGGEPCE